MCVTEGDGVIDLSGVEKAPPFSVCDAETGKKTKTGDIEWFIRGGGGVFTIACFPRALCCPHQCWLSHGSLVSAALAHPIHSITHACNELSHELYTSTGQQLYKSDCIE